MNIFSIGDGNKYELTRDIFHEKTQKKYPFFQDHNEYTRPYFAICPACNNPIQIINLYNALDKEEHTNRTNMHGRHFPHNVKGLPAYEQTRYKSCPLHNPTAFGIVRDRDSPDQNEYIRRIVENNRDKLYKNIKEITGFLFKKERVNAIIDEYLIARNYCYTHTNEFNIPYSILYTTRAISLFGQRLDISELGQSICESIKNNSNYFNIQDNRIAKAVDSYVSMNLLLTRHKIVSTQQYLTLEITEEFYDKVEKKQTRNTLFQKELEMKQYIY